MKTTKFLFTSTVLAAVLLSSACAPVDNGTFNGNSSGISEPVSSDPKESSGNSEESSVDIGVSKPASSSAEESSDRPDESNPESSGNSDNESPTKNFNYLLLTIQSEGGEIQKDFISGSNLGFYSTYIRYQQPVFYNTLDDPNLIDGNTGDLKNSIVDSEDPGYFKVKAGDKLENGLTVKSAVSRFTRDAGELNFNKVEFEGNLTLEGILYCDSTEDRGKLYFFADAAKSDPIPLIRTEELSSIPDRTCPFIGDTDKFAVNTDGAGIELGLIDEAPIDLSGIISPGGCVRAKITVSDLLQRCGRDDTDEFPYSVRRATLVSLEKLPD